MHTKDGPCCVPCRMDDLAAAERIYQMMVRSSCERNHSTYMLLLRAAETNGKWELALQLLREMPQAGIRATPLAYGAAIGACAAGKR